MDKYSNSQSTMLIIALNFLISQFFIAHIALKYDNILILADFNINIWCPSVMTRDFLNLLESFILQQFVDSPIHVKSHTRD